MKVLDANFLIDYLNGTAAAKSFYEGSGGDDELWVVPTPAYAEVLVGVGNLPDADIERTVDALAWTEIYTVNESLPVAAGRITDQIGPQGPFLDGVDGTVAAVGQELGAPVVSADSDLTHEETRSVIEVETYRGSSE